jgi:hypothetical protein
MTKMTDKEQPFITSGCNIESYADGVHMRLNFIDHKDEIRAVVLRREQIPELIGVLQTEIVPGQVVPIDQESLRIGTNYRLQGFGVRKREDNSAQLTLYIQLPEQGRTVTLNLPLTASDVTSLIIHLSRKGVEST